MKYLFVVNPVAGGRDKSGFLSVLDEKSRKEGIAYSVFKTQGDGDEEQLRQKLSDYQPEQVAAVGGDGTVQLVAKLLEDEDTLLGIIPFGSANGLATELEIPKEEMASLELFLHPPATRLIDMIKINDAYCCLHFADIGMNADLIRDFEQDRERGIFTYAKYFLKRLEQREEQQFSIVLDGQEMNYTGFMLALANARLLGTGIVLNRCGDIADGRLEVVIIQEVRLGDLLKAGWRVVDPEVEYGDAIVCLSGRQAVIRLAEPAHLQIDGELIGRVSEFRARILPKAIRVAVPQH